MILPRFALLAGLCCGTATLAQTAPTTPIGDTILTVTAERPGITARQRAVPPQLSLTDRAAYAQIFRDIDAGRFSNAETGLATIGLPQASASTSLIWSHDPKRSGETTIPARR